jgi:hypothetical protein
MCFSLQLKLLSLLHEGAQRFRLVFAAVARGIRALALTAYAASLTRPLSTAPFAGEAQEMEGAACAASGNAPHAASAARAICDLRNLKSCLPCFAKTNAALSSACGNRFLPRM